MSETSLIAMSGSCDCHVHIYDPERFPLLQRIARASWNDYQHVQRRLGLERTLLVQANGYGFDMDCLLDALAQAGDTARAIAVIPPDISDESLSKLHRAGVRGVRFMLIPNAQGALGWDALEPISARIAELGWVGLGYQSSGRWQTIAQLRGSYTRIAERGEYRSHRQVSRADRYRSRGLQKPVEPAGF